MSVKSVYNFVPAPKESEVFTPDWADKVSHDIPFSDGESGEIELKITAETPIFIRNGHSKEDAELFEQTVKDPKFKPTAEEQKRIDRYLSFSNYNGKYFIPATSLKGMFRNVLEIITASKLNPKLVNDDRYSFRDLTRNSLYMKKYKTNKVKAGWLKTDENDNWIIHECEDFCHIHHEEVDRALGTTFREDFLGKNPKNRTAKFKYEQVKGSLSINYSTSQEENKKLATYIEGGAPRGVVVLTGQSSKRNEKLRIPKGKVHEFVFSNVTNNTLKVPKKQKQDFKFIYLDHDSQNISEDWEFWKKRINKGERMPVFYTKNSNQELEHFGLAYMYKLPFRHSVHEMLPITEYQNKKDLAEVIFGSTENKDSLKGRVMIGHAFSKNTEPSAVLQKEILGGPKASYFPFYIKQENIHKGYTTYWDKGEIRGFKRYPIRSEVLNKKYSSKQLKNSKVFSYFLPLEKGAEFSFKIRFHNLRKTEIGALLSTISFHNNHKSCYHSLGGAKPFGYGKILINGVQIKNLKYTFEEYLVEFEKLIGAPILKSRLIELVSMASNKDDTLLDYPTLDMDNRINDFESYKKNKKYLASFSSQNNVEVNLIAQKLEKEKAAKEQAQKEEEERIAREEEQRLAESLKDSEDIEALEKFVKNYPVSEYTDEFKQRIPKLYRKRNIKEAEKLSIDYLPEFKESTFKTTQIVCKAPFKKNRYFEFSDDAKDLIVEQIKKVWEENSKSFYKKNELIPFPKFPWSDIINWLGEERAKALFDEFTNK